MAHYSMHMTPQVAEAIKSFIGMHPAERGGMLGHDASGVITHFFADTNAARTSSVIYDPNIQQMNAQIQKWKSQGITFCGFVHSHPSGITQLSQPDIKYAGDILDAFTGLDKLHLPIVMTVPDAGEFRIIPYVAIPDMHNRKQVSIFAADLVMAGEGAKKAVAKTMENAVKRGGTAGWWVAGGIAGVGVMAWVLSRNKPNTQALHETLSDASRER